MLLSCAGGCLGLIAVAWSMRAFIALAPANIPRLDETRVDTTVLLFTLALSIVTGVLFGLAPAIRTSRSSADDLTHATTRNSAGGTSGKLRGTFVVGQFALALVLLTGAGLLIRSLSAVQSVESGFGDRGVVTSHLRFHNALQRQRRVDLYQEATERMRRLPGVRAVGAVGTMFWNGDGGKFGRLISPAIDISAGASRKSSTFLGRMIGSMFMRVNSKCAHQVRPPVVSINRSVVRAVDVASGIDASHPGSGGLVRPVPLSRSGQQTMRKRRLTQRVSEKRPDRTLVCRLDRAFEQ